MDKILIFTLGSILGSFTSCLAIRRLRGESIIRGRSHCDSCYRSLKPYELIPVFSYIFQKGRCKCGAKIGLEVFLSEVLSGLVLLGFYIRMGLSYSLSFYSLLYFLLLKISLTDFYAYRILENDLTFFLVFSISGLVYRAYIGRLSLVIIGIQVCLLGLGLWQERSKKVLVGEGDLYLFAGLLSFLRPIEALYLLGLSSWLALGPALYLRSKGKKYIFMAPFIGLAFIIIKIIYT